MKMKSILGYSPFRGNASKGTFRRICIVAFPLFLTPRGALTLRGNHLTQLNLT